MNFLSDVMTYVRRMIKTFSNTQFSDSLLIDYINRFVLFGIDPRIEVFDLKTTYQFQTIPGVDQYNMPLYDTQTEPGNQNIGFYPVYQGFMGPAYVNGIEVPFFTEKANFFSIWPQVPLTQSVLATGNGTSGPYTLQAPIVTGKQPMF